MASWRLFSAFMDKTIPQINMCVKDIFTKIKSKNVAGWLAEVDIIKVREQIYNERCRMIPTPFFI